MNGASKSNQDLNKTYATTIAIDDMKCATAMMPELRKPLNNTFLFLAEYRSAIGQPCPGSSPCKSPINATPKYAGLIGPASSICSLIIAIFREVVQINQELFKAK
jgi:hypothetical protein